ncbi:MAG: HAD hydrolase family protein [Candidatus Pacebacteria bacterium]|nr:HAD hydrolase family protein [Candidatus Paceibacterota bacterium]
MWITQYDVLRPKFASIEILALDFDGTLTDGFVHVRQDGMETVRCSRRDSLGTNLLQAAGVKVVIISKETNPVVQTRAQKMKVDCYHGVATGEGKLEILRRYAAERQVPLERVSYMGDDINDLECIKAVGLGITVADGHPMCIGGADFVTTRKGGEHAVREVCDLILEAKR